MTTPEQQQAVEMYLRQYEHDIPGFALWLLSSTAQDSFHIPFVEESRDKALKTIAEVYPLLPGELQFVFQHGLLAAISNVDQAVFSMDRSQTLSALVGLAVATTTL